MSTAVAARLKTTTFEPGRPRILIFSASIGEGHDLPARALVGEFVRECPTAYCEIVDGIEIMGQPMKKVLVDNSRMLYDHMPWMFDFQYSLAMRYRATRWLSLRLMYLLGADRLLKYIGRFAPDIIVSTYPGTTALLGESRQKGLLDPPCYSSITDLAGLYYWAHPGIDLHFVTHPESIAEVEKIAGPDSVRWACPPTSAGFFKRKPQEAAKKLLGLPQDKKVVVVSGGGWGIGDLRGAIETVLERNDSFIVCICGRNAEVMDGLNRAFSDNESVRLIGYTEQMSDLLAAADTLIHSTTGLTVLEAIIRGCPVISYGFPVGHVRLNNSALEHFGLASVAKSRSELVQKLSQSLASRPEPDTSFTEQPTSASLMLRSYLG